MKRYIDAEKLLDKIVKKKNQLVSLMHKLYYAANYKEWEAELNTYNKITSLIKSLQQEQPDVDLDALVNEAFDKYSFVDGYGQLSVSFNRAELYSFIKKITRKDE